MSDDTIRYPLLDKMYQQYLADENSAAFIKSVSSRYCLGTLSRLFDGGQYITRRASILAIGFLGDFRCNETIGRALCDRDRAVRLLADHGIRQIWMRQGSLGEQQSVRRLYRLVTQNRLEETIELATDIVCVNPLLGEAWNQRAIAFCGLGDYQAAIEDCRETMNCNRYHFPAAMGMAHCCLQLDDINSALDCFRLALNINPDLEGVRNHILHLERIVDER